MGDLWVMSGECVLGWARRGPDWCSRLPAALSPVPGPVAVIGARYDDSPVGPYLELSVAEPARLGLRTGMCVTTMAVSSPRARAACRERWDLPAEIAAMRWSAEGEERSLVWEEREIVLRARPRGPWLPAVMPLRSLQSGAAGPVVVPRRFGSRLRLAEVDVDVPAGDSFASLRGRHAGAMTAGARMVTRPARRPAGMLSSIPLRVRQVVPGPEPAGLTATMVGVRAYGSVG
ncbi:MAG: hypothetical protein M3P85_09070 [Actinomycetota bacterium]|nr:hypothetical protein [Actinomycetota bacterium]PLS76501.1 MAG: hypothetical protein CYG61_01720 [Actinomycetota bacterium]